MNRNQTLFAIIASAFSLILIFGVAIIVYFGTNNNSSSNSELIISDAIPGDYSVERTDVVNGKIEYKNAGSSSCPPVIDRAKYDEKYNTYYLYVKEYGNTMCTADLQSFKQVIEYEDGTEIIYPSYIEVIYPR